MAGFKEFVQKVFNLRVFEILERVSVPDSKRANLARATCADTVMYECVRSNVSLLAYEVPLRSPSRSGPNKDMRWYPELALDEESDEVPSRRCKMVADGGHPLADSNGRTRFDFGLPKTQASLRTTVERS
jgi:hypothetical protein